ncbi:hypothetical protein CONLIGDRAFT_680819 [Coniochaeta ligniaria NRRL 30616]|uniref:Uncharacterized protein n=1 Tax=Coniochaeta ligniaria NRRL 30616 TaxID=1408157 RepID=A0A1J7JL76_9PEZI|nr:hypothetical protein CONLIGDRAFT_680819 [Coniochaeta ligniaria NRRL 30616]
MGSTFSVAKTLIIPALISLILYLVLTYLVLPLWTRYRTRYSYNPLPLAPSLDSLSSHTSGLRARIQSVAGRFIVPSAWRRRTDVVSAEDEEEGLDFEDGEELGHVNAGRREAGRDGRGARDDVRRLSRDLEEGFMDDSDEEVEVPARSR